MIDKNQLSSNDRFELENAEKIIHLGGRLMRLIADNNVETDADENEHIEANVDEVSYLSNKIFELATPAMDQFEYLLRLIDNNVDYNKHLPFFVFLTPELEQEANELRSLSYVWYELFNQYCDDLDSFKDSRYLSNQIVDSYLKHGDPDSAEYKLIKAYRICKHDNIYPLSYLARYH